MTFNDIQGLMVFPSFALHLRKNPEKTQPGKLTRGPLGERQPCYSSTTAVVDMYRTAWCPESSCAIDTNIKEVDRQWIAQELIFNFINMPFMVVQFDNITSKFDSVPSFCYRFAQVDTNCSLHKELPTSGLPIPSLVQTLNDNTVVTTFYPTLELIELWSGGRGVTLLFLTQRVRVRSPVG